MKYLLSVLILFSGLGFTYSYFESIYLVCDEPYTFYPDKSKRWLLQMDETEVIMYRLSSDNYRLLEFVDDDLKITDSEYYWGGDRIYTWRLDRETLMLNGSRKCKKVLSYELDEALIELKDIIDKTKAKRKI